jgi:uncharacterized protein YjiK
MKMTMLIIGVLVIAGLTFRNDLGTLVAADKTQLQEQGDKKKKGKKKDKDENEQQPASADISINQKWDLPAELKEISGLAWLTDSRFACVQDEEGKVFIYNTVQNKIEKEIPFAGPGDYEGITIKGNTIYIVRADGRLYEVDMNSKAPAKEYKTPLTVEHNIEGLCYDKNNDRLLLAAKDDLDGATKKHIYAFDLNKKELLKEPAYSIDLSNEMLNGNAGKKKSKAVMPSAIAIHPRTNELFITDGPGSRLLILTNNGHIKQVHNLGKDFAQPEGITFSPAGDMFISNEGTKNPGNILKVTVQ